MKDLVVAANRSPIAFTEDQSGAIVVRHGAGGVAPSLANALAGRSAHFVAAAMSPTERRVVGDGIPKGLLGNIALSFVDLPESIMRGANSVIANSTLWFLHHGMFESARRPIFDRHWHEAWDYYRQYNRTFAEQIATVASHGATVVVNDYHLALSGSVLARERGDLRTVHFSHTPFCSSDELRMLPIDCQRELVGSMGSFGACGFHTQRWADAFRDGAQRLDIDLPPVFVAPLGVDAAMLNDVASSDEVASKREVLLDEIGSRRLIVRSDRIEMSKNLIRGFLAFEELLETRPRWRDEAIFIARTYGSREEIPEYLAYRNEVERVVHRINERFGSGDRVPVILEVGDDYPATIAALSRYDVLLVNPIRDGMNLVAKEGPVLNTQSGVLVLSTEAGAFAELGEQALGISPFDVTATAVAIERGLELAEPARSGRAARLAGLCSSMPPERWLDRVMGAAQTATERT